MKLISNSDMRRFDVDSAEIIPEIVLMENAGRSMAEYIYGAISNPGQVRIVIIVGPGHNGGDALVVARWLCAKGLSSVIGILSEQLKELPEKMLSMIDQRKIRILSSGSRGFDQLLEEIGVLTETDVLVDGFLGSGISRPMFNPDKGQENGYIQRLMKLWNASPAQKYAVDVPSGSADTELQFSGAVPNHTGVPGVGSEPWPVLNADVTLACQYPRDFLLTEAIRSCCGHIKALEVGFPIQIIRQYEKSSALIPLLEYSMLYEFLPELPANAHKGVRGRLEIHAGSPGYAGAAALACKAAAAAGAGMLRLELTPGTEAMPIELFEPSVIIGAGPADWANCLLVGPGWGGGKSEYLEKLLARNIPIIVDADGLRAAADLWVAGRYAPSSLVVFTPHPGEAAALLDWSSEEVLARPFLAVKTIAGKFSCICLLKSSISYIGNSAGVFAVHDGGNPALGTAGSGDVLAGMIAGLMTRRVEPNDAICSSVICHACAAARLFRRDGWFTASALAAESARLFSEFQMDKTDS